MGGVLQNHAEVPQSCTPLPEPTVSHPTPVEIGSCVHVPLQGRSLRIGSSTAAGTHLMLTHAFQTFSESTCAKLSIELSALPFGRAACQFWPHNPNLRSKASADPCLVGAEGQHTLLTWKCCNVPVASRACVSSHHAKVLSQQQTEGHGMLEHNQWWLRQTARALACQTRSCCMHGCVSH